MLWVVCTFMRGRQPPYKIENHDYLMALKRIVKDYNDISSDASYIHISAGPRSTPEVQPDGSIVDEKDWMKWDATIYGPEGTPYAGGVFKLEIDFPTSFPFNPPLVKFTTNIFHPNISPTGMICLDILKSKWSPALTIGKTLLSISSLLAEPNPNDPYNAEAGAMYLQNRLLFEKKAREWTQAFAG